MYVYVPMNRKKCGKIFTKRLAMVIFWEIRLRVTFFSFVFKDFIYLF